MQWRPEPTHVEKCGDELGVAVKFQSNSEIAGSPRNSFRASVEVRVMEVEQAVRLRVLRSVVKRETAQTIS